MNHITYDINITHNIYLRYVMYSKVM